MEIEAPMDSDAPVDEVDALATRIEHIDELGHVNNAVWVQWIQDMSTAHWDAAARAEDRAAFFWVVTRHEIDYRGNIDAGESVTGETWIEGPARGATRIRHV